MNSEGGSFLAQIGQLVAELYSAHSEALMQILGFDNIDCWVFLFLFCMKVYEKRPTHSRYEICKAINAIIISSGLLNKPQQISEKKVYKSIDKLARLGYLSKKRNKRPRQT